MSESEFGERGATDADVGTPDWEVRPYRRGDDEAVAELYDAVYARRLAIDYYRWKLIETPWTLAAPNVWVADAGRGLAGHYGATPLRFKLHDEIVTVGHTGDAMTHPDFRRQGVFTTVARAAHEAWAGAGVPFMIGVPNDQWLSRRKPLGYREQFQLAWFWRPLRPEQLLARRFRLPGLLKRLGALGGRFLRLSSNALLPGPKDIRVQPPQPNGSALDRLWEQVSRHYPALYVRDRAWLTYRYTRAPGRDYRIFVAQRGEDPAGYIVYRLRRKEERITGWIADLFTAPQDNAAQGALLRACLQDMAAAGAESARVLLSPRAPLLRVFRRAGFWRAPGAFDASLVALGQPLPDLSQPERWFTMAGDYDIV